LFELAPTAKFPEETALFMFWFWSGVELVPDTVDGMFGFDKLCIDWEVSIGFFKCDWRLDGFSDIYA